MAKKNKTEYSCTACGALHSKWQGQCTDCGEWNTLEEQVIVAAQHPAMHGQVNTVAQSSSLDDIVLTDEHRTHTQIGELDRVLGGGIVAGSVILIGGDPGIGKSTLLLQTLANLSHSLPTLYVSGEESLQQVSMRAQRLNVSREGLRLLTETCVERIINIAQKEQPQVVVIDSIQTVFTETLESAPGSVSQVREAAARLVRFAKQYNTALLIVGHVTKEGQLAGPRVLEHMVDTVLYFEGDSGSRFRIIRAIKNRFGAVNELGVFAMSDKGLKAVSNPSSIFLSRHEEPVPGGVITVAREGTRPLLIEVQALVAESHMGQPRRVTLGLEQNRLSMLLAVVHRHGGLALFDQDVFVNAVGGVKVSETAADAAMVMAALSSFKNRPISNDLIVFGEIGLAGEIRPVPNGEERLNEAAKHGFKTALVPAANCPKSQQIETHNQQTLKVIPLLRVSDLLAHL